MFRLDAMHAHRPVFGHQNHRDHGESNHIPGEHVMPIPIGIADAMKHNVPTQEGASSVGENVHIAADSDTIGKVPKYILRFDVIF